MSIHQGKSTTTLQEFQDASFDWVYIDTNHTYRTTKEELALCRTKVKPGGIIAGHDYNIGQWISNSRYGVIEAVHEFCVQEHWEMIYLTCETHQMRSFALRKIREDPLKT